MKTNNENELNQTQTTKARTPQQKLECFIELRAEGFSLGKISELIDVPKTTLFNWNVRHRETIDHLKRIVLEALEESILGSHQKQFAMLTGMLKRLDDSLERKMDDYEDDLSLTETFWMAANLRTQVQRLRNQTPVTDLSAPPPQGEQNGTIWNENPPPPPKTT